MTRFFFLSALFLALVASEFTAAPAVAEDKIISIGTGSVTGVYYPAGGAICRLVNRGRKDHNIRCAVESTGGSIFNLNAIAQGELELGVVQSDWHYNAYHGLGVFADAGANQELRSIFSLYAEPFTVVARADSGITRFGDLKGKRVNIGNPGSGQRATMEEIMKLKGWTRSDFAIVSELKAADQAKALCDNKIDAMVFAAGHPNGAIQEVTMGCQAHIIAVDSADIDALIEMHPYYAKATIPGGMYQGNPDDITTFGVKATLVTSAKVDEEIIYEITKAVYENFDAFKTLHFVFATLDKKAMTKAGLTAPLHEGAKEYFEEVGLLDEDEVSEQPSPINTPR